MNDNEYLAFRLDPPRGHAPSLHLVLRHDLLGAGNKRGLNFAWFNELSGSVDLCTLHHQSENALVHVHGY